MGMDYRYAGSASYSRFDEEITKVAEILGGKLKPHYRELMDSVKKAESENPKRFFIFGTLNASKKSRNSEKYDFPAGFDKVVADWLNHPYKEQTIDDTLHIWDIIKYYPRIDEVAHQIWYEMKMLVQSKQNWYIY